MKVMTLANINTVDSREVARMVDMRHADLIRNIESYMATISENAKLRSQNYFIPDTYKVEGNNKTYKCYRLTKMGCEMVANKLTGKKGILFTAAYVKAFNEMEQKLSVPKLSPNPKYRSRLIATAIHDVKKTTEALIDLVPGLQEGMAMQKAISLIEPTYGIDMTPVRELVPSATHDVGSLVPTDLAKAIGMSGTRLDAHKVNILLVDLGLQQQTTNKKHPWELTEYGKQFGEMIPINPHAKYSGYQIKWNSKVVDMLKTKVQEEMGAAR